MIKSKFDLNELSVLRKVIKSVTTTTDMIKFGGIYHSREGYKDRSCAVSTNGRSIFISYAKYREEFSGKMTSPKRGEGDTVIDGVFPMFTRGIPITYDTDVISRVTFPEVIKNKDILTISRKTGELLSECAEPKMATHIQLTGEYVAVLAGKTVMLRIPGSAYMPVVIINPVAESGQDWVFVVMGRKI